MSDDKLSEMADIEYIDECLANHELANELSNDGLHCPHCGSLGVILNSMVINGVPATLIACEGCSYA